MGEKPHAYTSESFQKSSRVSRLNKLGLKNIHLLSIVCKIQSSKACLQDIFYSYHYFILGDALFIIAEFIL